MLYSYKSNGIVSRSISDYRDNLLSDFSNFRIWEGDKEFTEGQYQTVRISDVNYGTVGSYGSQGIGSRTKGSGAGSDTQVSTGGIHIVGERGPSYISGSAVCYSKYASKTNIFCQGGVCIYSYESGNVAETVGQHGSSVINAGIGARRIDSFQFVFDVWQPISRFIGAAECRAYIYEPCITEDYNELDYGLISANHTATIDNGLISHSDSVTITDRGHILHGYRTRFGFKKVIGEAQARATNAWVGSGRIRKFGAQDSPAIYGYITDGKVRIFGAADASFTTSGKGGGLTPLSGTANIGITAVTIGDGNLRKFGGSAESATWNPDEKQMLFSFTGGLTAEKHVEAYVGSGRIKNLAKVEAVTGTFDYVGSGGLLKLRPRKPLVNHLYHEKHTQVYSQSAVVEFVRKDYGELVNQNVSNCVAISGIISTNTIASTGCIQVAPGTTLAIAPSNNYTIPAIQTTPSSIEDYGLVSESYNSQPDYGWILDTSDLRTPYGRGLRFTSQVEVNVNHVYDWTSSGEPPIFKLWGDTTLPLDVLEIGEGTLFSMGGAAETVGTAEQGGGLYRIGGEAKTTFSLIHNGSGSLRKFSGAAESATWNPEEKQMLFSFTGSGEERHTEAYVGSGRLRNFAKIEAERGTFNYVGSGSLNLHPRKPQIYQLSDLGSFTLDFYSLQNAYINLGDFFKYEGYTNLGAVQLQWLTLEQSHEKHTEAYNNSACEDGVDLNYGEIVNTTSLVCTDVNGNITTNTTAATGCTKVPPGTVLTLNTGVTYTVPLITTVPSVTEDYGLVSEGNAPERRDYGWILGSTSKVCPFGAFEITGNAATHYVENIITTGYSVSGKAGLSLFGEAATFWTPPYHGEGLFRVNSFFNESFTPWIPPGEGILWSMGGAAEATAQIWKADGLFKIGGDGYTLFSLLHIGSGIVRVTGEGEEPRARVHTGSGSLKKFSGAAESTTWNPEEKQMLFSILGTATERFTANPPEEGTEVRISGEAVLRTRVHEDIFGRIPVSGVVGESFIPAAYIGSGSFKKFSGAAESITFNPLEKQMLFSFIGSGAERVTLNPPEEGAEIRIGSTAAPYFFVPRYPGSGRIPVAGIADTAGTRAFIGSGSLKKFSGAAESITFNPDEKQMLFSFRGEGLNSLGIVEIGSGRLFTLSGATESSATAYATTGLFRVGGESTVRFTPNWIGSGSLRKFSGAAESITFNPDEKQMLFSFTGAASSSTLVIPPEGTGRIKIGAGASDYRFWPNWISKGGVKLSGDAFVRFTPNWIGSGSLKKFSGAAESLTFNPDERQMLFSFTGAGAESTVVNPPEEGTEIRLSGESSIRWVPNNVGSGNIFITGTAKTHYVPDIEGSGGLWTWNGAAESQAIAITSIPSLFRVYGDGHVSRTRPYTGSGSLRKLGGSAESLTFNPDERQMLFSFLGSGATTRARSKVGQGTVKTLGESTVRFSPVYFGSGTARVSGEATITRSRHFVGFGSLKKISGAAESLTWNPEEKQMLFSFFGIGSESRTSKLLSQSGVLTVRGTSGDPLLTFAEQKQVEIDITGDSVDLRSHAYAGSGRISNVNNADESFTRDTYDGSGRIGPLGGFALVQIVVWQPAHTQVWII